MRDRARSFPKRASREKSRALAIEPDILFLDEPTTSIDVANTEIIEQVLLKISQDKKLTLIIVTHNAARPPGSTAACYPCGGVSWWNKAKASLRPPSPGVTRKDYAHLNQPIKYPLSCWNMPFRGSMDAKWQQQRRRGYGDKP